MLLIGKDTLKVLEARGLICRVMLEFSGRWRFPRQSAARESLKTFDGSTVA